MKKLYPEMRDVSPVVALRASRIIERHFRTARVNRAFDLPEEGKLRLFRELKAYLAEPEKYCGYYPTRYDENPKGIVALCWYKLRIRLGTLWGRIEDQMAR